MSKKDDEFKQAIKGKKIPIISLDNKWYKLMNGIDHTPEMKEKEEKLKSLLKRQGKLNNEMKSVRKEKATLMDKIVNVMDEDDAEKKQADYSAMVNDCNKKLDELQDELLELPAQINEVNTALMLDTMEICYSVIAENTTEINEMNAWIDQMRIELKKNIVRRQKAEMKNQQMHDIFGPEVIDMFDMTYNPEDKPVVPAGKGTVS